MMAFALFLSLLPALVIGLEAPSSVSSYTSILSRAKLQAPTSSQAASSSELLSGFSNKYFFLTDGLMTFKIKGDRMRSELRQMELDGPEAEWSVKDRHKMIANVLIPLPQKEITELTFLQILCTDGDKFYPAMRISWRKEFEGKEDVVSVTMRVGTSDSGDFRKFFLAQRENRVTKWAVVVKRSKVFIKQDREVVLKFGLRFWRPFVCNFKGGVYIQNPTSDNVYAMTMFESLSWN